LLIALGLRSHGTSSPSVALSAVHVRSLIILHAVHLAVGELALLGYVPRIDAGEVAAHSAENATRHPPLYPLAIRRHVVAHA